MSILEPQRRFAPTRFDGLRTECSFCIGISVQIERNTQPPPGTL